MQKRRIYSVFSVLALAVLILIFAGAQASYADEIPEGTLWSHN